MSYRQAVQHIQNRYMLRLAEAPFNIKDESLVREGRQLQDLPEAHRR
jgi:hypothetical protein